MPRRRERESREREREGPQVPIDGEVLKTLLAERDWGASMLATQVGRGLTSQQNISDILASPPGRKCRRNLRRRIAKVLGVPEELLAGEPFLPPFGHWVAPGVEYRFSRRTEWAASRLLTQVARACERDLKRARKEIVTDAVSPSPQHAWQQTLNWVTQLIQIQTWRRKLLVGAVDQPPEGMPLPPPPPSPALSFVLWSAVRPTDDPYHEAGVLALIRAIEHLLKPWFDDASQCNYRALRDLAMSLGRPTPSDEPFAATNPFAALTPVPSQAPADKRKGPPEVSTP
jgi:hypothetical protein